MSLILLIGGEERVTFTDNSINGYKKISNILFKNFSTINFLKFMNSAK